MQGALSVGHKELKIKKVSLYHGQSVPWEVAGYEADFRAAESTGGYFDLSHWSTIEVLGVDSADYLHRMSTINVVKLPVAAVAPGAFLTGKGTVVSFGVLYRERADRFLFFVPPPLGPRTLDHLEQFHFAEKLVICDRSSEFALFGLWDRGSVGHLPSPADAKVSALTVSDLTCQEWRFEPMTRLRWVLTDRANDSLLAKNADWGPLLGLRLFEFYRMKYRWAQAGAELLEKDLILEGNVDWAVARSKGCYPGQEVVERIFTYGRVNRKLVPVELEFEGGEIPSLPFALLARDGSEAGEVRAADSYPDRPALALGLAMVRKAHWSERDAWTYQLPESAKSIKVRILEPEER